MRTLLSLTLLLLGLGASTEALAQHPTKDLQVEDVTSGKFYAYTAGRGMRSTSDGKYYTMMDDGHTAVLRYSFQTGELVDTLFSVNKARECEFKKFDDYILEPKGHHILLIAHCARTKTADRSPTAGRHGPTDAKHSPSQVHNCCSSREDNYAVRFYLDRPICCW